MTVRNMRKRNKEYLSENATALRNNMTKQEKRLWYDFLKKLPVQVKRQKVIGDYIVDFFIPNKNIVIEIDGRQHGMEENVTADTQRDEYMRTLGIIVLRYTNKDINTNFNEVCNDILLKCGILAREMKDQ